MGGHKIGGHTDLSAVKIPHHSIYKVTKDGTPKLYAYQERLAREGLKDPWIRNLVYKYQIDPTPFHKKYSALILGAMLGVVGLAGFVWVDKNKHMKWHHPHEEKYKLLYQLKEEGDQKAHH